MAFTAAMTKGTTWTGLLSNNQPTVRKHAVDLFRRDYPLLQLYQQFGRVKTDEPSIQDLDLWIENEDPEGLQPIATGYEPTTPTATDQAHGTPVNNALYQSSIMISEPEMMEADNESSIIGLQAYRYYKKIVAIDKDFGSDLIAPNYIANSLRIYGLEGLVPPYAHAASFAGPSDGDTLTAPKWVFRQCTNTIQGVTRTAWTSETAGGTGFESCSVDGEQAQADITTGEERFGQTSSGNANGSLRLLLHMDGITSEGGRTTDVLAMSPTPHEDLMLAETGKIRYGESPEGSNGMFQYPKWRNKFCVKSEFFRSSGLIGNAVATADDVSGNWQDVIWGLYMPSLLLLFTENGFFRETEWMPVPMQMLAFYMGFFVAAKHKFVDRPDSNFNYFHYGCNAA